MHELDADALQRKPRRRVFAAIVRPKPLHETVVERLRNMIVEGELEAGERLHDSNLAGILQVSRTPIREATKLLATEGLVDLLPGRGARVSELSVEDILDLFETIAGVERHACELAAERMSGPDLRQTSARAQMHGAASRGGRAPALLQAQSRNSSCHCRSLKEHDLARYSCIADVAGPAGPLRRSFVARPLDGGDGGARTDHGRLDGARTRAARVRSCASTILALRCPSSPRFGPPCPNRDGRLRFPNGMFRGRRTTMLATRTSIVSDMSGPRGSHSCGNACLDTVEHDRADLPAIFTPSPAKGAPPKGARRRARGRDGSAPRGTSDGLRADVSRAIRRLETADQLREQRLRQPKHRAGEKDREGDRDEEDHIDRQRSA